LSILSDKFCFKFIPDKSCPDPVSKFFIPDPTSDPDPAKSFESDRIRIRLRIRTVNVDFLRIEYMVLAKYQHMSILELILLVKQHSLILCTNLLGVDVLIIVN
jgi:hypothetical protein